MSTRWYPLYQKGNPQLRIFLPNLWMKLIKGMPRDPPNRIRFIVSQEMSNIDVQNYLEKIYKVPVVHVNTELHMGEFKKSTKGYIIKDDDYKIAHVTLPEGTTFEFPDLYPEQKEEESKKDEEKNMKQLSASFNKLKNRNKHRPDVPGWFTV